MLEQYSIAIAPYGKDPCWRCSGRAAALWEKPTMENFGMDCLPWMRPNNGAGEELEEEVAAEMQH